MPRRLRSHAMHPRNQPSARLRNFSCLIIALGGLSNDQTKSVETYRIGSVLVLRP
jgi:hypothetical protein